MAVSSTASVAITRVRRVRELHVVVIFDLAFWSANPPGLRHGRVTTRARRNVLGAVASDTHSYIYIVLLCSSLFFEEVFFFQVFHIFLSTYFLYYICVMYEYCTVSYSGLRICLKRCQAGWGCCVLHHTMFLESWDSLGRLGTAWGGLEGLGWLRKISRTV